jgi:hypothetical protein
MNNRGMSMFIVVASGGEYDEAWSRVKVCSKDPAKLQAYITGKVNDRIASEEFQSRLSDLYQKTVDTYPKRERTLENYEKPRWSPGLGKHQITQTMIDEREAWQTHYNAVMAEITEIENEWRDNVWYPIYRQFLIDEGKPVPEVLVYGETMGTKYFPTVRYEIEEIPEL